jgi:hypothetical protein
MRNGSTLLRQGGLGYRGFFGTPRGLGLATATISAALQLERRIRSASLLRVTDQPTRRARASGSISRHAPQSHRRRFDGIRMAINVSGRSEWTRASTKPEARPAFRDGEETRVGFRSPVRHPALPQDLANNSRIYAGQLPRHVGHDTGRYARSQNA